jgi:hypothetical protein
LASGGAKVERNPFKPGQSRSARSIASAVRLAQLTLRS